MGAFRAAAVPHGGPSAREESETGRQALSGWSLNEAPRECVLRSTAFAQVPVSMSQLLERNGKR